MNISEINTKPDDSVFLDIDYTNLEPSSIFGENQLGGKYYYTVGNLREMASNFNNDAEYRSLVDRMVDGFSDLDKNKPKEYEKSAEIRNEYDEEYSILRRPVIDYIFNHLNFPKGESNEFIYMMISCAIIEILNGANEK